jgi:hypothetical protein
MSEPGFASLGPSLLARKGGAKPAMRPQVAPLVDETAIAAIAEDQLEDLGWNDMGDSDSQASADIVPINADVSADDFVGGLGMDGGPIVRRQQRRLEERVLADAVMTGPEDAESEYDEDSEPVYGEAFDDEAYADEDYADDDESADYAPLAPTPVVEPVAIAPAPRAPRPAASIRVPASQAGRRAAFTLRLDADRHLKLRLAATMQSVSAQALVTEALDRLLAEYDDLDVIANHLKRH